MKKFDLDDTLHRVPVPDRPDEYWEDFPGRVARQLNRPVNSRSQVKSWLPRLVLAATFAGLFLIIGFMIGHRRGQNGEASAKVLENVKFVRETLAMFPNRVRAITYDVNGMKLVLSEQDDVATSPPLYVEICDGHQCAAVVTFSGQQVEIAGQKVTVLSDAANGVILESPRFIWSSADPVYVKNGLKIQARQLSLFSL